MASADDITFKGNDIDDLENEDENLTGELILGEVQEKKPVDSPFAFNKNDEPLITFSELPEDNVEVKPAVSKSMEKKPKEEPVKPQKIEKSDSPEPKDKTASIPYIKRKAGLSIEEAKRIAEVKFSFFKFLVLYMFANIILVLIDFYLIDKFPEKGHWVHWPILVWGLAVVWYAIRAFVMKGMDLRTITDRIICRMAEKEKEKSMWG